MENSLFQTDAIQESCRGAWLGTQPCNSLVREELEGAAARGDLTHGVAAPLAEPRRGGRLVVDIQRGVGPLCWGRTGGRAEQTAEARDRKRVTSKRKGPGETGPIDTQKGKQEIGIKGCKPVTKTALLQTQTYILGLIGIRCF